MTPNTDHSTDREWDEGISPMTQVREYPMGEHTPGPWFISNMAPCPTSRTVIMAKRTNGACGVAEVFLPPYPEGGEANARLIRSCAGTAGGA